jgi:hypothetical protein
MAGWRGTFGYFKCPLIRCVCSKHPSLVGIGPALPFFLIPQHDHIAFRLEKIFRWISSLAFKVERVLPFFEASLIENACSPRWAPISWQVPFFVDTLRACVKRDR